MTWVGRRTAHRRSIISATICQCPVVVISLPTTIVVVVCHSCSFSLRFVSFFKNHGRQQQPREMRLLSFMVLAAAAFATFTTSNGSHIASALIASRDDFELLQKNTVFVDSVVAAVEANEQTSSGQRGGGNGGHSIVTVQLPSSDANTAGPHRPRHRHFVVYTYDQRSGVISGLGKNGQNVSGMGCAGLVGQCRNNPQDQCVPGCGPLPRGMYWMNHPINYRGYSSSFALQQFHGKTCQRGGFFITGGNCTPPHNPSTGSVIVPELLDRAQLLPGSVLRVIAGQEDLKQFR